MAPHVSTPIEEYAVLGDTETAALVSRAGSIDWLCLPRFDSTACFAALLGTPEHGRWLLGPKGAARSTRRYVENSFVLETIHETDAGAVKVLDLMPLGDGRADIVRSVEGLHGSVTMRHEWIVRFDYGKVRPWVSHGIGHRLDEDVITAVAGPDMLVLRGTRLPHARDGRHEDEFEVAAGQTHTFSTTWFPSFEQVPPPLDIDSRIAETIRVSNEWADRCDYQGPHRELVVRSLLTLRGMTHSRYGGIVAAPTTSLPEDFGGERNWDYRYCWLRDASLTLEALLASGYVDEARLWRNWLLRAVAGDPEDLQIMYAIDGSRRLPERTLDHLPGYAGSTPVRIGNGAVDQRQSDVLGEVMIALDEARAAGLEVSTQSWAMQRALIQNLARHWQEPDNGLWEIRGPLRHFTHSRVMVWAAFDRAVRGVEKWGLDGPVEHWRELRDQVRDEILDKGFNAERNTFTQHYDTAEVDASLLLIPLVGFLPPDDPRVLGTVAAIEQDLMREGFLLRYRTETGVDGLAGDEHPFLACSWWLVSAYAVCGQVDKARDLMDRLVALFNDVGLISEEYDPHEKRMVGNFPQAFSHLTFIGAAHALAQAEALGAADAGRQQP
ncbi:glycoside hydrolase family 15 protein [Pedococcus bigeumensis]|uniref:Trehalase n=1 Tax=Pedococcus bigeumensis TaxID=433644 RepID=A0A502CYX0_9MICO|nr:glycoside hydrolase family 15 protein [Pedococcus bigeumensis]TPG17874.1 glycoside hydrolase family 15 protein [Pedococcus bigeumensis]